MNDRDLHESPPHEGSVTAPPAEASPADLLPPPTVLSPLDHVTLALAWERVARKDAEIAAVTHQRTALTFQRAESAHAYEATLAGLRARYALGDADTVALETGAITRG